MSAFNFVLILVVVLGISNRNLKKQLSASPEVNTAQSTEVQDDSALIAELEKTVAEQELALADQQALVDALQQDSRVRCYKPGTRDEEDFHTAYYGEITAAYILKD